MAAVLSPTSQQTCLKQAADALELFPNTPWSDNKKKTLLPNLIRIIKAISGDQIINVVNAVVLRRENNTPIIEQLPAVTPYTNIIRKLGEYADTLNSIDKWKAVQFVAPDIKVRELKALGWTIREEAFNTAKKRLNDHNGILMNSTGTVCT